MAKTWAERVYEALSPDEVLGEETTRILLKQVEIHTSERGALDICVEVPAEKTKQVQEILARIWPDEGSYGATTVDEDPHLIRILRKSREHNPIKKRRNRK